MRALNDLVSCTRPARSVDFPFRPPRYDLLDHPEHPSRNDETKHNTRPRYDPSPSCRHTLDTDVSLVRIPMPAWWDFHMHILSYTLPVCVVDDPLDSTISAIASRLPSLYNRSAKVEMKTTPEMCHGSSPRPTSFGIHRLNMSPHSPCQSCLKLGNDLRRVSNNWHYAVCPRAMQ